MSLEPGRGALVVAFLQSPKERLWGMVREIDPSGVWLEAISLDSFEDWARQVGRNEAASIGPSLIFYPMFRVEKLLVDRSAPDQPSIADRFRSLAGVDVESHLGRGGDGGAP